MNVPMLRALHGLERATSKRTAPQTARRATRLREACALHDVLARHVGPRNTEGAILSQHFIRRLMDYLEGEADV